MREPLQRSRRALTVIAAMAALGALAPAGAGAAETEGSDSVFWSNTGASVISHAALSGTGGADFAFTGTTVSGPSGTAIDAVAGVIYWANGTANTIAWARFNGPGGTLPTSGATVDQPRGLAIDPAAKRVYWANSAGGPGGNGSIAWAALNGAGTSGGGELVGEPFVTSPDGVAVDPSSQMIYWANSTGGPGPGAGSIMSAKLGGTGLTDPAPVPVFGASVNSPSGLALDPYTDTLYWADSPEGSHAGVISYANLKTGIGGDLSTAAPVDEPEGIAIDPVAGRLYWANAGNDTISYARLDGTEGGTLSTSGATTSAPAFPALLVAPVGAGAPQVSGQATLGSVLTCQKGSWAGDAPAAFYFRAPRNLTWQWSRNGSDLPGATAATYTATAAGSYTCSESAKNHAGTTVQTSAALVVSGPPTATTGQATSVGATSATLNGTVAPQYAGTGYYFEYGLTAAYGARAPVSDFTVAADGATHDVSAEVLELQPNRSYHYRLVATNANGSSVGADGTFLTSTGPVARTGQAGSVTAEGSVLTGTVNPENLQTAYYFQFGPTPAYGSRTPYDNAPVGSDMSDHQVTQSLSALSASTTYHFRLVAVNASGTSYGDDMTFTTAPQPAVTLQPALALLGRVTSVGAELRVRLVCTGTAGQHCHVSATVRAVERLSRDGRRILGVGVASTGRHRTVIVATHNFEVAVGSNRELRLRLNATGRMLRTRFGRLPTTVAIRTSGIPGRGVLRTVRVTFGAAPPRLRLIGARATSGTEVSFGLNCSGGGARVCDAKAQLTTYERLGAGGHRVTGLTRRHGTDTRVVVLAQGRYSVRTATTRRLRLQLNQNARALLRRFQHIPATLRVVVDNHGHQITADGANVTLK